MFCKKKATLLVAILCVFAVSFVACSKKEAVLLPVLMEPLLRK